MFSFFKIFFYLDHFEELEFRIIQFLVKYVKLEFRI